VIASESRRNSAVLVIDVQRDVVADAHDVDDVIANINTVIDKARAADVPVIWIQHHSDGLRRGSPGWEFVDELRRSDDEPLLHKTYGDAFEATDLETLLTDHGIGHLLVTGAQTDFCVRATLHGALARGYDTTLVADAHTTDDLAADGVAIKASDVIAHTNHYWRGVTAPGRSGSTVTAAEVDLTD